jgi:hypothetical protein
METHILNVANVTRSEALTGRFNSSVLPARAMFNALSS